MILEIVNLHIVQKHEDSELLKSLHFNILDGCHSDDKGNLGILQMSPPEVLVIQVTLKLDGRQ